MGTFDECERRWALHYQRWKTPPEMRRDVMYQYKLMPSNAWVGQIADDCITSMLRKYHEKQSWPQQIEKGIRHLVQQYLDETQRWIYQYESGVEDPESGRRQPIDRVFFGRDYSPEEIDGVVGKAMESVQAWLDSGIRDELVALPLDSWQLPPSDFTPWFDCDGVPVWAKYDFATHTPEETRIYDWKTGELNEYSDRSLIDQLHTYALYAFSEWQASPQTVKLFGVWLSIGAEMCAQETKFQPEVAERLKAQWKERYRELKERLGKVPYGGGPILFDLFPMTDQPRKCLYCAFHCCEGFERARSLEST